MIPAVLACLGWDPAEEGRRGPGPAASSPTATSQGAANRSMGRRNGCSPVGSWSPSGSWPTCPERRCGIAVFDPDCLIPGVLRHLHRHLHRDEAD
jgi:hypothetical protein